MIRKGFKYSAGFLLAILLMSFCSSSSQTDENRQVVENLRAFTKLYGYVKYFHPSDGAAGIDWERFALYGVEKVKNARDKEELKTVLEELFLPLAPTVQIYFEGDTPKELELPENTDGLKIVAWQHRGVWLGSTYDRYRSIRLNRKNKLPTSSPSSPATVVHRIDAAPYLGKEIKFSAAVRAEAELPGVKGSLVLRVDKKEKEIAFYDVMADRPIKSRKWKTYQIEGKVDDEAVEISFGCGLSGSGKLWVDDFQLAVKNEDNQWVPIALKNPGFEEDEPGAAPASWETKELSRRGPKTENLSYTFKVIEENAFAGKKCLRVESPYEIFEGTLYEEHPRPGEFVDKLLGAGLYCRVPLALYSDDSGTLGKDPNYPLQPLEDALDRIEGPLTGDREDVRLGDIVIAWNIFQHFYPYFDVVKVDWDNQLTVTLRSALTDRTAKDFYITLRRFMAALQDGHGSVYYSSKERKKLLPFSPAWIENRLVVLVSKDDRLKRGDIIVSIDGKPAEQVHAEAAELISGSPHWKRHLALYYMRLGPADSTALLKIQREGKVLEIQLERNHMGGTSSMPEFQRKPIEKLEDGIYYVDIGSATLDIFEKQINELAEARGVVFDLRGYPTRNFGLLNYLLKEKDTSAAWMLVPRIIYPDREKLLGYMELGWEMEPKEPRVKGKVVFLTDNRAISAAESYMSFVEFYKLGEIVGEPTAGTNGNINPFRLPGGYNVWWTGMRVVKHDGSQHHLIGILPTVPVQRTIADVVAGRDTYLEKALEIIRANQPTK